jgi:hypothetical protein
LAGLGAKRAVVDFELPSGEQAESANPVPMIAADRKIMPLQMAGKKQKNSHGERLGFVGNKES